MNTKRCKHTDTIHAWAEGAEIQWRNNRGDWVDYYPLTEWDKIELRIKPKAQKKDYELARMEDTGSKTPYYKVSSNLDEHDSIEKEPEFRYWVKGMEIG